MSSTDGQTLSGKAENVHFGGHFEFLRTNQYTVITVVNDII